MADRPPDPKLAHTALALLLEIVEHGSLRTAADREIPGIPRVGASPGATPAGARHGVPICRPLSPHDPSGACERLVAHIYAALQKAQRQRDARAGVAAASALLAYTRCATDRPLRASDVVKLANAALRVERALARGRNCRRHARKREADLAARPRKNDLPRCGARCRTKDGAACSARVVVRIVHVAPRAPLTAGVIRRIANERGELRFIATARCRIHGGLSTGPKTEEGRRRCAEAGRLGAEKRWTAERASGAAAVSRLSNPSVGHVRAESA